MLVYLFVQDAVAWWWSEVSLNEICILLMLFVSIFPFFARLQKHFLGLLSHSHSDVVCMCVCVCVCKSDTISVIIFYVLYELRTLLLFGYPVIVVVLTLYIHS